MSRAIALAAAIALFGCDGLRCGVGTVESDGACVPFAEARTCGEGTVLSGTMCVPQGSELMCGVGTVAVEGLCVPEGAVRCGAGTSAIDGACFAAARPTCGPGTVEVDGECMLQEQLWVRLPFVEGQSVAFGQSNRGSFSHDESSLFAVDFPCAEDTPIVAAREGTVVEAREDSDVGCGDTSCADAGNFLILDHGDGTFARYWHLRFDGVDVEVGDTVCAGEIIGRSGNTGFSTAPHLHFAITDVYGRSLPTRFEELRDVSAGMPFHGAEALSDNRQPAACARAPHATYCSRYAFAYMGVELTSDLPCGLVERDRSIAISGHDLAGTGWVRVSRRDVDDGVWRGACVATEPDGSFTTRVTFESAEFTSSHAFLMIAAADATANGGCAELMGWSESVRLALFDPAL